eukprot:scaffold1243_cov403-Prasinococcus_capsulatus_cf.AAC.17
MAGDARCAPARGVWRAFSSSSACMYGKAMLSAAHAPQFRQVTRDTMMRLPPGWRKRTLRTFPGYLLEQPPPV